MAGNSIKKQNARTRTNNIQLNRLSLSLEALQVGLNDPRPGVGSSSSSGTAYNIAVINNTSLILNIQTERSEKSRNHHHNSRRGQHGAGPNRNQHQQQQVVNHRSNSNRAAQDGQAIHSPKGQAHRNQQPEANARTNRVRSTSSPRQKATKNNELNCSTCKKSFGTLQIYQCGRGHGSCYTCMKYGKPCGNCRGEITPMRNFAVEEYFSEKLGQCPHSIYGCKITTKLSKMHDHVKECAFGSLKCVFDDCYFESPLNKLVSHWDVWHREQLLNNVGSELKLSYPFATSQNLYVVKFGGLFFLFRVLVSTEDSRISMVGQLIGSKVDASKWMYEIHVYTRNESRRKFIFSDVCISFADTESEREGRYCTLTCAYASTFAHNGVLTYKFFIKKIV